MRKLTDVARSPRKGELENFGGITPKAKGIPSDVAFKGIDKKGAVGVDLPESTGFTIKGKEQEAPAKPFAQTFWEHYGTTIEEFENRSTFFGLGRAAATELHNSTAGAAFRAARYDDSFDVFKDAITPTKWNSYVPTEEDIQKLRNSGLPPSYYHVVTGGDAETWDDLIAFAKKNYEMDRKAADAGMGAKLTAGIMGAAVDPLTYVPGVGNIGKGAKLVNKAFVVGAESAASAAVSEGIRTSIVGGEADYQNAILSGAIFGAGFSAVSDGIGMVLRKKGAEVVPENDFAGPAMRLEARETAINTDGPDLTRIDPATQTFDKDLNGLQFADHPVEPGAVIMPSGSVMSATNPFNPKTIKEFKEIDPERAARGAKLFGFTELGQTLLRSESKEVRGIAQDLVRAPVGMESGSHGKFGATASDIVERLAGTDNMTNIHLMDAVSKAMSDPSYSVGPAKMSKDGIRQEIFKKAALAIERPELQHTLTDSERAVMDIIKRHFDIKRELMETPAIFGNERAVSIFPNSRHKGTYVPHVYDRTVRNAMVNQYGAEGLQEAIAQSWMVSYRSRPEVKTRVDEALAEANGVQEVTPEMVRKYAMDKAFGIAQTDKFSASSVIEEGLEDLTGIENNSFLEARNLFDSDMPITMPDGKLFSVNDLRDYDMSKIIPAYNRRVNGDIAIMGGSGKTTADLKSEILDLKRKAQETGDGKLLKEYEALAGAVKLITGRSRKDPDTAMELVARSLSDIGFFTKNAYMGAQNLTEVAGLIVKGNLQMMTNNIPYLRELTTRKSAISAKEAKELHGALFGRELDDTLRPQREDIIQRLRETSGTGEVVANIVGTLKYGTQEMAARSPFTKFLNQTSNGILNTARQGVLLDIATHALKAGKTSFGKENYLKGASITPEQWKGITQLFKDHAEVGTDGKFTIKDKDAFTKDPRSMDLWRIADKFADEVILRPHKVSSADTKAYNAWVKMAMQFKNFVVKSMNGRFIRSWYTATKNNRALDQALSTSISIGLSGAFYAMSTQLKALGLPESQRDKYLDRAFAGNMLTYGAITRSSVFGGPAGIFNILAGSLTGWDPAQYVRTSVLPKEETKRERSGPTTSRDIVETLGGNFMKQVPAVGTVGSFASAIMNAADVLNAPNRPTEMEMMTGLMNSVRELVPNDPLSQQIVVQMFKEQGIYLEQ